MHNITDKVIAGNYILESQALHNNAKNKMEYRKCLCALGDIICFMKNVICFLFLIDL